METKANCKFGGVAHWVIRRTDGTVEEGYDHNLVVDEGLNYLLNASFGQASVINPWYMGLLNNYTPVAGSTMTNFGGNEFTNYDEAARQEYVENAAAAAQSISNSSSPCVFTCSTNSSTVYGIFLASISTKSGTSGTALSGILFSSSKALDDGDTLTVTYNFGAADDGV